MNRVMMAFGIICAIIALICLKNERYVFATVFGVLAAIDVLGALVTEKRARLAG